MLKQFISGYKSHVLIADNMNMKSYISEHIVHTTYIYGTIKITDIKTYIEINKTRQRNLT